ncbi:hypothetical protein [Pendulispora albinea]|uniref:Uncharacterized protein n=1 Tax=Pendulispora albinea TaxID=2741071 RepID=A0ABZ2LZW8_9BACT
MSAFARAISFLGSFASFALLAAACHRGSTPEPNRGPDSPGPARDDEPKTASLPSSTARAPGSSAVGDPSSPPPDLTAAGLVRRDGARRIPIPWTGSLQNPCWSPDGRELVITRFLEGYNKGLSLVARVAVADGTPIAWEKATAQDVNLPGSCWNKALGRIAFSSDVAEHDEIYLADPRTSQRTQVTRRKHAEAREPSISPDGRFIVFESHAVGSEANGSLWRVGTDGRGLVRLTDGRGNDRQPNWSPAGDRILFQSNRRGNFDIYTIDPNGRSLENVTQSPAEDTDAAWSPDGTHIVYSSDEGSLEHANLFVIARRADQTGQTSGGKRTRVTHSRGYDGAPSWSPDGRFIAFESSEGDPEAAGAGTAIYVIAAPKLP